MTSLCVSRIFYLSLLALSRDERGVEISGGIERVRATRVFHRRKFVFADDFDTDHSAVREQVEDEGFCFVAVNLGHFVVDPGLELLLTFVGLKANASLPALDEEVESETMSRDLTPVEDQFTVVVGLRQLLRSHLRVFHDEVFAVRVAHKVANTLARVALADELRCNVLFVKSCHPDGVRVVHCSQDVVDLNVEQVLDSTCLERMEHTPFHSVRVGTAVPIRVGERFGSAAMDRATVQVLAVEVALLEEGYIQVWVPDPEEELGCSVSRIACHDDEWNVVLARVLTVNVVDDTAVVTEWTETLRSGEAESTTFTACDEQNSDFAVAVQFFTDLVSILRFRSCAVSELENQWHLVGHGNHPS